MIKQLIKFSAMIALVTVAACDDQVVKTDNDSARIVATDYLDHISADIAKVRDYVPKNAVMAHRGSTFWTPEETEAAYRWAREMGADYLEADLQVSKDGVILALHDDNLKRTTNIELVYGEDVPSGRQDYYERIGYTPEKAKEKVKKDKELFRPNFACYYTYEELMELDAGSWFNQANIEQARDGFAEQHQYISTLKD
ncbi:Glycerophosphoryl diester phosphodiesterase, partial [termite gut metagenome]